MTHVTYEIPDYLVRREEAKSRDRLIQVVCVAAAVMCVVAASVFVSPIDGLRRKYQLALDPETTKGLPPDMALLTKTGTFRAVAIDVAFMRMEELKEADKFYELDKLSTLICKLAPRYPSVWRYCAWNQAYNISVLQYSPEGRWYWVKNGINLIRRDGISYNPKSIGLYRELAWIFWHKVGDFLDDQHWYYKKSLALELERVLGPPPPAVSDDRVIDWFRQIAESGGDVGALVASDPAVADLVHDLKALALQPDAGLLEFVARNLRSQMQIDEVLAPLEEDFIRTQHEARIELLSDPERVATRDRLLACLRHAALVDPKQFNMDPGWMLSLMEEYGPLDWRTPASHTLYWATRGDMVTRGQLNLDENDSMNVVRMIFFSLVQSIKRGKLVFEPDFDDPSLSYLELAPDVRFIPYMHRAYLRFGKEQFGDDPRFIEGTAGPNYMVGHFSFLEDGIRQLYFEGGTKNLALAKEYYAYLRKYNRNKDGTVKKRYLKPLDDFVWMDFKEALVGFKKTNMTIGALVIRSLKQLSLGELESADRSMAIAKQAWDYYMRNKGVDAGKTQRRSLPPLADMRAAGLIHFMQDPSVAPIHKVRLWHALKQYDLKTMQMSYDRLLPYFRALCGAHQPPMILDKAFPEPIGMALYREQHPATYVPDRTVDPGDKS